MQKTLLVILMSHRNKNAFALQGVLTEYGCIIKTRLGIHDGVLDQCSEAGLIILELVGERDKHVELNNKIGLFDGVSSQLISLSL